MNRAFASIVLGSCMSVAGGASRAADPAPADAAQLKFQWDVKVPLRDGVKLNATLYLPKDQAAPAPCVFTLTPYISDSYHDRGVYFATNGYPFAIVDVRGRGNSEGAFRPFMQEAKDGYDVVEWLARQPYCNGKVAMWGGSYAGFDQWATAKELPPHLATIVPAAAARAGTDFPMRNNIFNPYIAQWLTYTSGHAGQVRIFNDAQFWSAMYRRWHESGRPFREFDAMLGNPLPIYQEWLNHPMPDAYWDAHNPTAEQYAAMQFPILTITSSYDDDQPGALDHYKQYMSNASAQGGARHYLILGPWDHAGTRTPKAEVGGVRFGPASLVDLPKLHLQWYAWTMQNGPRPEFLRKPVAYYVMGAEKWRYADRLEDITASRQAYFLDSAANADEVFGSGSLGAAAGKGRPDWYRYDPRDVSGPEVDAEAHTTVGSLVDQSVTFALRGKQLVYHSAPFAQDTEVSGFCKLSAWIAIDRPDTDLYVTIYEIGRDGGSIRLSTDAIRARYREGLRTAKLIRTREPLRYDFDRFTFVSRQIKRGHRLRLVISPMGRIIDTLFAEKNYNAGGTVAEESVADGQPVTVSLFHDRSHPSALYVPIGHPESPDEPMAPVSAFLAKP